MHLTSVQASTTAVDIGDDNGLTIVSSSGTESGSIRVVLCATERHRDRCRRVRRGLCNVHQWNVLLLPVSQLDGGERRLGRSASGVRVRQQQLLLRRGASGQRRGHRQRNVGGWLIPPARFADGSIQDPRSRPANPIRNATKISSVTSGQGGVAIVRANGRIFACGEATPYDDMGTSGGEVAGITDAGRRHTSIRGSLCFVRQARWRLVPRFSGTRGKPETAPHEFAPTDFPANVSGITNATNVWGGGSHECARLATGAVQCWGVDSSGELGDGARVTQRNSPVNCSALPSGFNVVQMALGYGYSCARDNTGRVVCWGQSANGAFGIALPYFSTAAVSVMGLP